MRALSRSAVAPVALIAAALLAVGFADPRQDDPPGRRRFVDMSPEEQMQVQMKMLELGQPCDEHELLASYAGTFETHTTLWAVPGTEPMSVEGTAEHEMILGGRFLQQRSSASYPMWGEVESLAMMGFDRRNGEFTTVGFDTLGTYWVSARGKRADDGVLTMSGTDYDATLNVEQVYDFVVEFVDEDTLRTTLIFHDLFQEGPFKLMEITARRKDAGK